MEHTATAEPPNDPNAEEADESQDICRTCLTLTDELRSIYRRGQICGQITRLADMLADCTKLEYFEDDGMPEKICSKCVVHVSKAFAFIQMCHKSDSSLREHQILTDSKSDHDSVKEENVEVAVEGPEFVVCAEQEIYTIANIPEIKYNEQRNRFITENDNQPAHVVDLMFETETLEEDEETEQESEDQQEIEEINVTAEYNTINMDDELLLGENDRYESCPSPKNAINTPSSRSSGRLRKSIARPADGPPFQCGECKKMLSNFNSYKYHMQLHSDHTPFVCKTCGVGFKTRNAYEGHAITHAEVNPHTCKTCGKSYRQAASLRSHMLSHSGVKPFTCEICGKGMTQKSGYKKHMLTHSGEKPHCCDICNKTFRYSSNLIMHRKSHSDLRPFACEQCARNFISAEQLKRHQMTHTGEKPFQCDHCRKCFGRKSTLQIHLATHNPGHSTTPFKCTVCKKIYANKGNWLIHVKAHHPDLRSDWKTLTDDQSYEMIEEHIADEDESYELEEIEEEDD